MNETDNAAFRTRLAEIRHDLRTPVGHITGYSEMLEEELEGAPWTEFLEDLKRIHSSGTRLAELIDELLGPANESPDDIDIAFTQHQLRMQLNHITGYCEILHELAEEHERTDLIPDLDKIGQAARNLTRTVERRLTPADLLSPPDGKKLAAPDLASGKSAPALPPETSTQNDTWLGEGGDILIVDDNATNRDLLQRRLQRQGYNTYTESSGEAAIEFVQSEPVDLILLDMIMPGLSGMEVLRHLKEDRALRNIPVIMLSALDDMEPVVQCVLLGAEDYILKPFNPILLKARIGATLEKYRLRKQSAMKLKVFISSAGDVLSERRLARKVISEINEELSGQVYLTAVLWEEEPLLASETAQSQIVAPRDTDIYVGILWARMGTKLPKHICRADGSRYDSGTEFEFEDAIEGYMERKRPDMLVYRRTADPVVSLTNREDVLDRLNQKERLERFIKRWFQTEDGESIAAVYHAYESEEQFEDLVSSHLRKLVMKRLVGEP